MKTTTINCDLCGAPPEEPFMEKFGLWYTRCSQCDFVYANPRESDPAQSNQDHNEDLLEAYAKKHYSKRKQEAFHNRIEQFDAYRNTNNILEIGCSTGGFLHRAEKMGWKATGVEPVAAVANYGVQNYGLDVHACYLEDANFEENSFDVVFNNAVLEHLPSPSSVLTEAFRVLRPGGVFFADTVNIDSYTWKAIGEQWKLIDPRYHLSLFTPQTLKRYCTQTGFKVVELTSHGVRLRANHLGPATGLANLVDGIKKGPLSLLSRFTLKGDSISVLAQKPV